MSDHPSPRVRSPDAVPLLDHAEAGLSRSTSSSLFSSKRRIVTMSDEDLLAMLRAIGRGGSDPLDSRAVSRRLGWTDAMTASSLDDAKGRLLVWGIRVGGRPGPRFEDIELTVQGRRRILAADVDATQRREAVQARLSRRGGVPRNASSPPRR
jgi:hypothetical protein